MRINLPTARARDDLGRFLRAGGFIVAAGGPTTLDVESPHGTTRADTRRDLELRLAVWRAMHPYTGTAIDGN
jgi:hypothetical protein